MHRLENNILHHARKQREKRNLEKPISNPTDRKQNFINFQAKQIEKLIKENRKLIQLQKEIENPESIYLPDKDLGSKIKVYSLWAVEQCDDLRDEIEYLVNLILDDAPNRKEEMLSVLEEYKNQL